MRLGDNGAPITNVTLTTPGGTVQDLINSLNAHVGGVGNYGQFSLNSVGALTFTPLTSGGASVSVISDGTQSVNAPVSISQMFGIGAAASAGRTNSYSVNAAVVANPNRLPLATLNLAAAANGNPVLSAGD